MENKPRVTTPAVSETIGGFNGPLFGLDTAPNGDFLVADASNGIIAIRKGSARSIVPVPGVTDVSAIGRNSMWILTGAGDSPIADTGARFTSNVAGDIEKVINLFEFESAYDPDGNMPFDSNPFDG